MDEPFGAIDPITRERLQDEFLRLHRAIRKTVIFVTHDIDEAIKMGDRIAILRQGGVLAQYAVPDEVLACPADDFVAAFVGADRGLKRLALASLADLDLRPAAEAPADGLRAPLRTSLRDALSLMLSEGGRPLTAVHDDGRPAGVATVELVSAAMSRRGALASGRPEREDGG
jgi:osmoprotectant transport system ATP-binding protein